MTGLEYHRHRRRLTRNQLAQLAGVHFNTVYRMEKGIRPTSLSLTLARLAKALDVPMRELQKEYADTDLNPGDHSTYHRAHEQAHCNCMEAYRQARNYTYRELGRVLGTSPQWAHQECCERDQPHESQIAKLAAAEGISLKEFCKKWCPANRSCSCDYR